MLECDGLLGELTTATGMRHGPRPDWDRRIEEGRAAAIQALGPATAAAAAARGAAFTRDERRRWLAGLAGAR